MNSESSENVTESTHKSRRLTLNEFMAIKQRPIGYGNGESLTDTKTGSGGGGGKRQRFKNKNKKAVVSPDGSNKNHGTKKNG